MMDDSFIQNAEQPQNQTFGQRLRTFGAQNSQKQNPYAQQQSGQQPSNGSVLGNIGQMFMQPQQQPQVQQQGQQGQGPNIINTAKSLGKLFGL